MFNLEKIKALLSLSGLLLVVSFAVNCKKKAPENTSQVSGFIQKDRLFPTPEAYVCFFDKKTDFDFQKVFIKALVVKHINFETNFKVEGFQDCDKSSRIDAIITFDFNLRNNHNQVGITKEQLQYRNQFDPKNIRLPRINIPYFLAEPDSYFAISEPAAYRKKEILVHNEILHEFFHLMGAQHEQHRFDNITGKFCKDQSGGKIGGLNSKNNNLIPYKGYDQQSIMNYCRAGWDSKKLFPSKQDYEMINYFYPNKKKSFRDKKFSEKELLRWRELHQCTVEAVLQNKLTGCLDHLNFMSAITATNEVIKEIGKLNEEHLESLFVSCLQARKKLGVDYSTKKCASLLVERVHDFPKEATLQSILCLRNSKEPWDMCSS